LRRISGKPLLGEEKTMKLRMVAIIAAIASITWVSPAKADTPIAALILDHQPKQEAVGCDNTEAIGAGCGRLKIGFAPTAIADDFVPFVSTSRVVMLSHQDRFACLLEGTSSPDGSVTCGFVDTD
jgi:hypothetical protein